MIATRTISLGSPRFSAHSFWCALHKAIATRQSRKDLLAMDDAMLKDIGISYEEAVREAKRSFWDFS